MTRDAVEHGLSAGDEPLIGLRYMILAEVLGLRGRLDEADGALERANAYLRNHPEPQGEIPRAGIAGELALARGREEEALSHLRRGVEIASRYNVDQDPQVELALIRLLVHRGELEEAARARDILARGAAPFSLACIAVADGLLANDPDEALSRLHYAIGRLEALGTRIDLARALLDLGRAERRAGVDPRPSFERARGS